jgi:microcystin-dependent protein
MSEPFVAEIKMFASNFAPRGYAFCNGQLMPIAQNTALFSILGTTYGGNGLSNFALPNLMGRAPMQFGDGPGLTSRALGEQGGAAEVTLTVQQTPSHIHPEMADSGPATTGTPSSSVSLAAANQNGTATSVYGAAADLADMGASAGGGGAHNNLQPHLRLTFIIALQGIFPPRN